MGHALAAAGYAVAIPEYRQAGMAESLTTNDARRRLEIPQKGWRARDGGRLGFAVPEWAADADVRSSSATSS
jgi:hypothetical protein